MVQLRKVNPFQAATLSPRAPNEAVAASGGGGGGDKESPVSTPKTNKTTTTTSAKSNSSSKNSTSTSTSASAPAISSLHSAKNNLVHINQCHLCSKLLHEEEAVIRYKSTSFHVRCFKCTVCGGSMRNRKVYEDVATTVNGSAAISTPTPTHSSSSSSSSFHLFCERCYLARLDRCNACGQLIEQGRIVLLDEGATKLHQSCFTCAGCRAPLEAYIEEVVVPAPKPKPKRRPPFSAVAPKPPPPSIVRRYCQPCYLAHCLPPCDACRQALRINEAEGTMEQLVGPDGRLYHPDCFRCDDCAGSLDVVAPVAVGGGGGGNSPASNSSFPFNKEYFPVAGRKLCRACATVAEAKEAAAEGGAASKVKSNSERKKFA